ncbi:HAD family phosphatase [Stieleria sp. JC731]|uniref:HAD family hydrolase n=1 Tax=Pirellulaceae TaxID=2691357 RepID=UPI001E51167D|nr:HAD family phosphatase [Stieleria sp. JC731]MCC9602979.1 HAD family phosphatase [Stieleria sp. JC731]
MTKIQFVYFDLGNIFVAFDPKLASNNLAKLAGTSPSVAWEILYQSGLEDRFEHGEISSQEFADQLRKALAIQDSTITDQSILDAISDMFTPIKSMATLVEKTRNAIGKVGILSNTCEAHWDWIKRQSWEIASLQFDVEILSCRVGAMKPVEAIYLAAEQAAGVAPESIFFIDDKQVNVDAARARGWDAHRCLGGGEAAAVFKQQLNIG